MEHLLKLFFELETDTAFIPGQTARHCQRGRDPQTATVGFGGATFTGLSLCTTCICRAAPVDMQCR